ncbi:uncharacterized protein [Apostichopus japonicus]|uniref:uncharacterized protein n=1 Tax=Stichopus japonicus TaxID=307972 RepID=UPI003AB8D8E2
MNRKKSTKIKRKMWDVANMEAALAVVRKKEMSIRQASRTFHVPLTTLSDRVSGRVSRDTPGPDPVLTKAEESRLAEWILSMNNIGHGPTRVQICETVKQILDANKRPNPFIDNLPGRGWYASFLKRHPEVRESYRNSTSPCTPTSRKKLDKWFKEYQETVSRLGIGDKPHLIWNFGELILPLDPDIEWATNPSSGLLQGENESSKRSRKNVPTLCAISAAGAVIPPSHLLQKSSNHNWREAVPCTYHMQHSSGQIDSHLFQLWLLCHFTEHAPNERPILMLFDGHSSFVNKSTKASALDNEIEFLCLPPHLVRQPIDGGLFNPLKIDWLRNVEDFKIAKMHKRIRVKHFPAIFKNTWEDSLRLSHFFDGFRKTGIFPQNREFVGPVQKELGSNSVSHMCISNPLVSKTVILKALEDAMPAIQVALFEKQYARGFQSNDPLYLTWKKLKLHSSAGARSEESSSESSSDSDEESSSEEEDDFEDGEIDAIAPLDSQKIETAAYEEVQSQGYHNVIRIKRKRKETQIARCDEERLGDELIPRQLHKFETDNEEARYLHMIDGDSDRVLPVTITTTARCNTEEAVAQRHPLSNVMVSSEEHVVMETDGRALLPPSTNSSSFPHPDDKQSIPVEDSPVSIDTLKEEKHDQQRLQDDEAQLCIVPGEVYSSPIQLSDTNLVQNGRHQAQNLVTSDVTATENEAADALVTVSMLDPESLKVLDGNFDVASAVEVVSS